jgi:hypothetical protein
MHIKYWLQNLEEDSSLKTLAWWEDNIKMDIKEIVWEVVEWVHLVQ